MTNPARTKNGNASLHRSFDRKRLGVISAILLGACLIPATGASAAGCEPGPLEVSFFQHSSYKGTCSVLGLGRYANSKAMGVRNDSISSIKVGSQANVTVCKNGSGHKRSAYNVFKDESNICQTFKKSIPTFKNERIKNDSISSATIFRIGQDPFIENIRTFGRCRPKDNQVAVAVYERPKYKGKCSRLHLGNYSNSKQFGIGGVGNDSISSIEFGKNMKARIIVCQHANFKGRCEVFRESISDLYTTRIGGNQITSIRVERR